MDVDGVVAEQFGEVACLVDLGVLIPQVLGNVGAGAGFVGEVVEAASAKSVEVVVATLERSIVREPAEVPLADEGGAVSRLAEEGRQCWLLRRQAGEMRIGERLKEAAWKAVLIAAGDEGDAGGAADGGVCVGLGEAHAFGGEAVDVEGLVFAAAIAGDVGVAEIVGHDVDDVGRRRGGFGEGQF